MSAFIKRRWILLSCAVVLLACSCIDTPLRPANYRAKVQFCLGNAELICVTVSASVPFEDWDTEFHPPRVGGLPRIVRGTVMSSGMACYYLPIWLPLAAVLGWLAIRELRWREKRAKAADSCETN